MIGAVKATVDGTTVDALPAGGSGLFTLCGEHAMTTVRAVKEFNSSKFFAAPLRWRSPLSMPRSSVSLWSLPGGMP